MVTRSRSSLFTRITVYYAVICVVLTLIVKLAPQWLPHLPFGPLDSLTRGTRGSFVDSLEEVVETSRPLDLFDDTIKLLTTMLGAILIALPLRWVYMGVGLRQSYNHAVASSLIILPIIVTGIVLIVQYRIALAFALAGIVAGVRYRTTLKNTSDALFVFAAIGVGLAAGSNALSVALVMTLFFSYTVLLLPPIAPRAEDIPKSPWKVKKPAAEEANGTSQL